MAKRRGSSFFPIKIPINTLSGGVGRQAPSKRLPSEAEELDNVFCTTERSIDKRNGFSYISQSLNLEEMGITDPDNMWWYWFLVGSDQRYLFGIDTSASQASGTLLSVWKITIDNEGEASIQSQAVDPNIQMDIYNYITFGASEDKLRACSVGSSLLVLNTDVKAGFTSGVDSPYMYDLNGNITSIPDETGREVIYQTSITVDPKGEAEVHTVHTDFIWGETTIDTADAHDDDATRFGIWKVVDGLAAADLPGPTNADFTAAPSTDDGTYWIRSTDDDDNSRYSQYIPVEDYVYPDGNKLNLGQSVSRFSDLKWPPDSNDLTAWNGGNDVETMIRGLYPTSGNAEGKGKIYYLSASYLSSTPGWYRVINTDSTPYLEKVRTPDALSVIDKKRMPMQIYLDTAANHWSIRMIDWDPRTSGTRKNNGGPSFFRDNEDNPKQTEIKAISYYRDRLFLATEDTLVSSRLGDFDNFFMDDPASLTFRDPIDLKISSNVYTPITFLQPFKDFLFIGTSGDTQYELMGSENQISPLTAEIAPTSFFPMTEDMAPLVMNNNLFFFSEKRLFIYFPSFEATGQQAFELSRHVPDYLPENYWTSTVSTAHNTIFAVQGDSSSNKIFCYRNQTAGDQIIQNAFFSFTLDESVRVLSLSAFGDHLYAVIREPAYDNSGYTISVQRMNLRPDDANMPRLDHKTEQTVHWDYQDSDGRTWIKINNLSSIGSLWDCLVTRDGHIYTIKPTSQDGGNWRGYINGYVSPLDLGTCTLGSTFTSRVTLSGVFIRDDGNNIIPGTLNLRYGVIRHHKTGGYSVEVTRKDRETKTFEFIPDLIGATDAKTNDNFFELNGVFKFPILSFSDDLVLSITSTNPNPLNLTNIELSGKFKRVPHFLTT